MKARVKATGEIVEVRLWHKGYPTPHDVFMDLNACNLPSNFVKYYLPDELEPVSENPIQHKAIIHGWVARNKNDVLYLFEHMPKRWGAIWMDFSQPRCNSMLLPKDTFPDLSWWNEPVEVEITIKPKQK